MLKSDNIPTVSKRIEAVQSVKGTRDLMPPETSVWQRVEEEARRVLRAYAFREIRTPILESTALFARSVGEDTDIVSKEMYTFQDRDNESLTLRPEATASAVRAYIEHRLFNEGGLQKLYYMGPMFRRERPQKGRYRQFYQIGAEALGSDHPAIDVESMEMLVLLLEQLSVQEFTLLLNSVGCPRCRPEYLKVLRHALEDVRANLCRDCQRRAVTNPLRVLDCKVEADQPIIEQLPRMADYLCPECRQHFEAVKDGLESRRIDYRQAPRLVRGLDYYTRTTFEITCSALGAQNAVLGGGRYDGLSEMLGGPPAPGFGFAIGEDRLALVVMDSIAKQLELGPLAYVAWIGEAALGSAENLARALRRQGISVEISHQPMKLKKSLGTASKLAARFAIIIGEGELESGRYQVKDMTTGQQTEIETNQIERYLQQNSARAI